MDPSSRRELWRELINMRDSGRCVIFTTHYLEEADKLADRKAVMAKGQIKAQGTSRELIREFGLGYIFKVELKNDAPSGAVDALHNLVEQYVPADARRTVSTQSFSAERAQAADAPKTKTFRLP